MNEAEGKRSLHSLLQSLALTSSQGRWVLLKTCNFSEAMEWKDKLRKELREITCPETLPEDPDSFPWDRARILVKRQTYKGQKSGAAGGWRIQMEYSIYLELLLPPSHPNCNIWNGEVNPRDREWGALPTVRSDSKRVERRKRERKTERPGLRIPWEN